VVLGSEENILRSLSQSVGTLKETTVIQESSSPLKSVSFSLKAVGKEAAKNAEKELLRNVLHHTHWRRKKAAQLLEISYRALLYKLRKYDLSGRKDLTK